MMSPASRNRGALRAAMLVAGTFALSTGVSAQQTRVNIEQGWSNAERQWWYNVSQGSRLLPESWLMALEQPDATGLFLDAAHVSKFGYIPRPGADGKPGLPIGFARDVQSDLSFEVTRLRWLPNQRDKEPWVGLNCAACHTGEVKYQGRTMRIEGGPTSADFQSFFRALNRALRQTRSDDPKFARFAVRVLGPNASDEGRQRLRDALDSSIAWQNTVENQNLTKLDYGHARLDAVGHILNKVAIVANSTPLKPFPSDAPVSYPVIWNAPQHDKVQWNGLAENDGKPIRLFGQDTDFGALGRNTGEVIGVFADVTIDRFGWNGFRSSVQLRNLIEIERSLKTLWSPRWPTNVFNANETAEQKTARQEQEGRGKALYMSMCENCHKILPATDMNTKIQARMIPMRAVGTDIWMACNAWDYNANSGLLAGTRLRIFKGDKHGETAGGAAMLVTAVTGSLIGKADSILGSLAKDVFGTRESTPSISALVVPEGRLTPANGFPDDQAKRERAERCLNNSNAMLAYKARPLNGIWASAPYLHNGSVPTLYDLLTPSAMPTLWSLSPDLKPADGVTRPDRFFLGSGEFDPEKVGLNTKKETPGNTFEFRTRGDDGLEILGNANTGHVYGTDLTHKERLELIAFLKTL